MYYSPRRSNRKHKTLLHVVLSLILVLVVSVFVVAQPQDGPATGAGGSNVAATNNKEEAIDAFVIVFLGGLVIGGVVLLVVLLVARRRRSKDPAVAQKNSVPVLEPKTTGGVPSSIGGPGPKESSQTVANTSARYSPYRIDQEVRKLVAGSAHGVEVLMSRDPEDRRAIETSLLKTITSSEFSDEERNRAREALESYGFIARNCATLLTATNAFDRISAARTIGQIGSPSALPFLLEALHDADSTVRNQVVLSIGDLRIPSSMGVLLDMARRHTDLPANLLNKALSASSASDLAFLDESPPVSSAAVDRTVFDIVELKSLSTVPDLPETSEEQSFRGALAGLSSDESEVRRQAAKVMAEFAVKESVTKLSELVRTDEDADVKSTAINSLVSIDHPSVFPAILLAMVDDSRMVQAAAARALSRVNFDRSEEYVRLLETADEETLKAVADACIASGTVHQNIERLVNKDLYQAYETFALISLVIKSGQTAVVVESITAYPDLDVCLMLIHLLTVTHEPEVLDALEQLGNRSDIRDELKIALRGCRTKSEQLKTKPKTEWAVIEDVPQSDLVWTDNGISLRAPDSPISNDLLNKLTSKVNGERAAALNDLAQIAGDESFHLITHSFDDPSPDVRNAAARALYDFNGDRAASFTRALREGSPERRRRIGSAIAGCGLASDAIVNLTVQNSQKTYDAFSVLFLMAKAGEVQPLIRAIETYPSVDVRVAIVTLLALSAPPDILPTLRRLGVRGSQPENVRTALTEAICRISSTQGREAVVPV